MAEEPTYPSGPFPADGRETIAGIMREVGISNLSIKVLRKRLEGKYKIEFTSHKPLIQSAVDELMTTAEFKKELARIQKANDEGLVARGTKKKAGGSKSAAADTKGSKKEKQPKEAKEPRTQKEKKPDNYPKPALSGFFLFGNAKRAEIKAANPAFGVADIGREIGSQWKLLSDADKAVYTEQAAADKKRFEREMEEFLAGGGSRVKRGSKKESKKSKKSKKDKDPNAPKRPSTAFFIYINEQRPAIMAANAGIKITEVTKVASAAWKALSPEELKKYEALAVKDKERYARECSERGFNPKSSSAKQPAKKKAKKDAAVSSSSSSSSDSSDSSDSDSDSSSSDSSSSSSSSSDSD